MILINRTKNDQCTMVRMAGSFRMFQEDWNKREKRQEQNKEKSINLKTKNNE